MLTPPHLGAWHLRAALGVWSERDEQTRAEALYSNDSPQWVLVEAIREILVAHDDWPLELAARVDEASDAVHALVEAYSDAQPEPMHRLAPETLSQTLPPCERALAALQLRTERWISERLAEQARAAQAARE